MKETSVAQTQNQLASEGVDGFCKPKVGTSILSAGTNKPASIWGFSRFSAFGKPGRNGEQKRFCQPQKQDHLFPARSHRAVPSQGEAA